MEGQLYVISSKGLGHLRILVSVKGPGANPPWVPRDSLSFGEVRSYTRIYTLGGVTSQSVYEFPTVAITSYLDTVACEASAYPRTVL